MGYFYNVKKKKAGRNEAYRKPERYNGLLCRSEVYASLHS